MPRLTSLSFKHKGNRYTFEFDLDDAAIMKNKIAVDVVSKVTDGKGQESAKTLTVQLDFENSVVEVLDGDRVLKRFDLGVLRKKLQDWDEYGPLSKGAADEFGDQVNASLGNAVEELISSIPVPDPIFGCLIKAGVSATIGQTITCYNRISGQRIEGAIRHTRALVGCLMQNAGGIFTRAVWRTLKCMGAGGFA